MAYRGKRALDVCGAVLGLLLLWPLLAGTALVVSLCLGRPLLFRQIRPGLHERPFAILKFRSMTDAKDAQGNLRSDRDRLTRVGYLLRATSLDELPSLWNVLRGEMSLVGPRPLLVRYGPCYTDRERLRFQVRPGITGLAQINGRNALSWEQRLEYDAWYVEHCSLTLDLKILLLTVVKVLRRSDVHADPTDLMALDEVRAPNLRDGSGDVAPRALNAG